MHISEMVMNIACMECGNLSSWHFFYIEHFLRCMSHEEKLSIFSDLEAAISAALHESLFVINTPTVFLIFCYIEIMQITCCICKDFVRQLKAFLPSFCHSCACEMIMCKYFTQLRTRLLRLRLTISDQNLSTTSNVCLILGFFL